MAAETTGDREFTPKEVPKTRNLWLLFLAIAFAGIAGAAVFVHQIPYLTDLRISRKVDSLTVVALTSASIIGRLGFGWLGDVFDKRHGFAIAAAIKTIGVLDFSQVRTTWQIITSLVIIGVWYGGVIPLRPALQTELFRRKAFGTIQGILIIAITIGSIVAPVFARWVFDTTGSYRFACFVLTIITSTAIPAVLTIKRPK